MKHYQDTKQLVQNYYKELSSADSKDLETIAKKYLNIEYMWHGVHPFNTQKSIKDCVGVFWEPFYRSWSHIQRREDVFIAGKNMHDDEEWTLSMGHFMGIMKEEWIHINPVQGMAFLRYVEFNQVRDNKIVRSAFFCDIIDLMRQAGLQALPMATGSSFLYPGPRTHDGLLYGVHDPTEGETTLNLVNRMIDDLSVLNKDPTDSCPPEVLRKTWHEDMIWYGPSGIGASYTIPLYQKGHQLPFRRNLKDKVFNDHICRLAEGNYAGIFGWPNLTNTPTGGFLGMTANEIRADMRVVDVYKRDGDKLAENWVIIDIPHWLLQQGLHVIERCKDIMDNS